MPTDDPLGSRQESPAEADLTVLSLVCAVLTYVVPAVGLLVAALQFVPNIHGSLETPVLVAALVWLVLAVVSIAAAILTIRRRRSRRRAVGAWVALVLAATNVVGIIAFTAWGVVTITLNSG